MTITKKIILFGTGDRASKISLLLDQNKYEIIAFCDNEKSRQNHFINGKIIISPDANHNYNYDYIIITSIYHYNTIKKQLLNTGIKQDKILSSLINNYSDLEASISLKESLKDKDFSIISDDCWGAMIYSQLDLEYTSPFIWLAILGDNYTKLIKAPDYYLNCELRFQEKSEYNYPIGFLDDVMIHFNHYKTVREARDKWFKRLERFEWNNLYIKQTILSENNAKEFNKLGVKNKIAFTDKDYNIDSGIFFDKWPENQEFYGDFYDYARYNFEQYFNVFDWLLTSSPMLTSSPI